MLSSSRFNYLIEITQKLIAAVVRMREAYAGFPSLIEEEHAMIRSHDYTPRLEAVCEEKTVLAEGITQSFEDLQQLTQQLFNIWGDVDCEGTASFPGDLSNCIEMLKGIHQAMVERQSDLAANVLDLQISRLQEELMAFKVIASDVKPKIELNRSALTGIVRSYQDSTRVLFELAEAAQATYSPQGTAKKSSDGVSTIFVRA